MLKLSKSLGGIQFRLICPEGVVLLFRVNGRPDVCGPAGGVAGRLERPDLRALPCPAPDADPVPAALDAVAIGVTRPDIEADLGILVDQDGAPGDDDRCPAVFPPRIATAGPERVSKDQIVRQPDDSLSGEALSGFLLEFGC